MSKQLYGILLKFNRAMRGYEQAMSACVHNIFFEPVVIPIGAETNPDKRGGELCVEGTNLTVVEMLYELAYKGHAEARRDVLAVNKCLYGLADWLRTQNWMKPATPGAGHVVGENCPKCGSVNYGPDGAAMAETCWDCGYVKSAVQSDARVEKRCELYCGFDLRAVPGANMSDDGPPWDNCRFWKPKEKQP